MILQNEVMEPIDDLVLESNPVSNIKKIVQQLHRFPTRLIGGRISSLVKKKFLFNFFKH